MAKWQAERGSGCLELRTRMAQPLKSLTYLACGEAYRWSIKTDMKPLAAHSLGSNLPPAAMAHYYLAPNIAPLFLLVLQSARSRLRSQNYIWGVALVGGFPSSFECHPP